MRDHDETPYIVVEREGSGGLGSFILGALVGAGLALLFAPQSGEETQEEIKSKAVKLKDVARERVREAQENFEGRLSTAREHVQSRVDSVRDAVDSGRKAAVEARGELEKKLERSKAAYRAGIDAAREAGETPADDPSVGEIPETVDPGESEISGEVVEG
jgi:gas vesicle protein